MALSHSPFYALNEPVTRFPLDTVVEVSFDEKIEVLEALCMVASQ
jgi:hypothetical protein